MKICGNMRRFGGSAALMGLAGAILHFCEAAAALPDLRVSVSDSPDPAVPAGRITYTLTVKNAGTAPALNVRVVDKLATGTRYVSSTAGAGVCRKVQATKAACSFPAVPAGGQVKATVVAEVLGACQMLVN